MKVHKFVIFEKEVSIDISAEEIASAISEDPEQERTILLAINNFYKFMKAVPKEIIDSMSDQNRKIIYSFLLEQTEKFKQ